jgi:hypothetical protein
MGIGYLVGYSAMENAETNYQKAWSILEAHREKNSYIGIVERNLYTTERSSIYRVSLYNFDNFDNFDKNRKTDSKSSLEKRKITKVFVEVPRNFPL